jgi:hypothetical protein
MIPQEDAVKFLLSLLVLYLMIACVSWGVSYLAEHPLPTFGVSAAAPDDKD